MIFESNMFIGIIKYLAGVLQIDQFDHSTFSTDSSKPHVFTFSVRKIINSGPLSKHVKWSQKSKLQKYTHIIATNENAST